MTAQQADLVSVDESWTIADSHILDDSFMQALFPDKAQDKRAKWLQTLLDNEFESIKDLENLTVENWAALGLPLRVQVTLQNAADRARLTLQAVAQPAEPTNQFEMPAPPLPPPLTQLDVIVMDVSSSMHARSKIDPDKTREDVSKLLFHTMVDKLVGLELNHAVGILAFGETVTPIELTREYERFHDHLGRLDANQHRTRLYDAIHDGAEMLNEYSQRLGLDESKIVKRLFVLTDGEDNASKRAAWQVAQSLQQSNVVLDAIGLAGYNATLQCLSAATNGGLFVDAVSVEQAVGLFEREAILHVAYRESADPAPVVDSLSSLEALQVSQVATGPVLDVVSALPAAVHAPVLSAAQVATHVVSSIANKRVLKEYLEFSADNCRAFVGATDVMAWKLLLPGPTGTPYEGGTWLLTANFPVDYPFKPPRVKFITPMYHCNVNKDGGLCLDILKDHWSPALTISKVMLSIQSLLGSPNPDDPLDSFKGQLCRDHPAEYLSQARAFTAQHASASIEDMERLYNLGANS